MTGLCILPLGNSITQADTSHDSYRYPLWKKLIDAQLGNTTRFTGSMLNFFGDELGTMILLVLLTMAFLTFVILPAVASGPGRRRNQHGGLAISPARPALLLTLAWASSRPQLNRPRPHWY